MQVFSLCRSHSMGLYWGRWSCDPINHHIWNVNENSVLISIPTQPHGSKKMLLVIVISRFCPFLTECTTLPGTPWGSGAGRCGPPSSGSPALLSGPRAATPPGRCPSAGPSGCPAPPPAAGRGRPGRADPAPDPPRGWAAALACAGCGSLRPGGGSSLRSLEAGGGGTQRNRWQMLDYLNPATYLRLMSGTGWGISGIYSDTPPLL